MLMGIFRRLKIFWQTHHGLPKETELSLEMLVAQVDEYLAEARGEVAYCDSEEKRLASMAEGETRSARRMLDLARQALCSGRDALAEEAAKRHLLAKLRAQRYSHMWQQQHEGLTRLTALLAQLEAKREEILQRQQQLTIRRQLTRARRTLMESLYSERSRWQIEHAEESMVNEELFADAYQELAQGASIAPRNVLEETEEQLNGEMIESVLSALRREIALPPPTDVQDHEI